MNKLLRHAFLCLLIISGLIGAIGKIFIPSEVIAQTNTKTFTLDEIPLSAPEIINPGRGSVKWRGHEEIPEARPALTMYERFEWRTLEPTKDTYNFAPIDQQVAKAKSEGRKYAFRVRDVVPEKNIAIPDYLKPYSWSAGFIIPDYNHPYYIERANKLVQKLAEKYDGNDDIEYIDIIMYGKWAENHLSHVDWSTAPNGIVQPKKETLRKLVDIWVDNFQNTQLIQLRGDANAADHVIYALRHPRAKIPVGTRNDCLGKFQGNVLDNFSTMTNRLQWEAMKDQWKIAPFHTEYCARGGYDMAVTQVKQFHVATTSNNNWGEKWIDLTQDEKNDAILASKLMGYRFVLRKTTLPSSLPKTGDFTLTSVWSNVGTTPAYHDWDIELQLRKPGTTIPAWTGLLTNVKFRCTSLSDTRCLLPTKNHSTNIDTPRTITDTLNLNNQVASGTYDLVVKVTSDDQIWKVLKLANQGKTSDNAYLLGQVTVGTGTATTPTPTPRVSASPTPTPIAPTSQPYKQFVIPGSIQAEDYNLGGQNIGYYDTTVGNMYKFYRDDDVDVKQRPDGDKPIHVGGFVTNEWMKYTFNVPETAHYSIDLKYATALHNAQLQVTLDSNTTTVTVPETTAWSEYADTTVFTGALSSGPHTLTIKNTGPSGVDLDSFTIGLASSIFPSACDANLNPVTSDNPNGDNIVDLMDYSILVNNFLADPIIDARADINKDGMVDLSDYSILINFFTETCDE